MSRGSVNVSAVGDGPAAQAAVSLLGVARLEAERHKWLESEKAGCDLGEEAIRDWSRRHWRRWLRERWIEHLNGERRWDELSESDFGLLQRAFHPNVDLVAGVVERIKAGGENLDILRWVVQLEGNVSDAIEILARLNINAARLNFWRD